MKLFLEDSVKEFLEQNCVRVSRESRILLQDTWQIIKTVLI